MKQIEHEFFMKIALKEAENAFLQNEIPIGAILILNNKIVAKAHNQTQLLNDPTAHAEMLVITQACASVQSKYLTSAILYCTVEPCIMCYGAIVNSQISTLVYATTEPKTGFSKHLKCIAPKPHIISDVFNIEAQNLMVSFFKQKRCS